ncbi:UNVERIFIED_ORG: hypothetical protein M2328_005778 [Rhodococcus erythropolis]
MSEIVKFLEARLAEDEAIALKAGGSEAEWLYRAEYDNETGNEVVWANSRSEEWLGPAQKEPYVSYGRYVTMDHEGCLPAVDEDDGTHIARHDPARILREVAAKRVIIEAADEATGYDMQVDGEFRVGSRNMVEEPYVGDVILRALAAAYSDHPDYSPDLKT